jgi:DNA polymerase-1
MAEQNDTKQLLIIDGTAFVYRAFYGMQQQLTNSQGQPTAAILSFTRTLLKLLEEGNDHIAICFDRGGKSKRDELYAAYKADRPPTPDALISQFPYVRKIVEALGVLTVEMLDYEADDVAGTLAKQAEAAGFDVLIMTNDKDMLQLISPKIKVHRVNPRGGFEIYDAAACKRRYGIEPYQIPDYLALAGDSVDQIPGVKGIGEKTAPKLLSEFGTVETLLQRLSEVPERFRTKLEVGESHALLSKKLATLETALELPITLEGCEVGDRDNEALLTLFRELEFHSLLNQIATDQEMPKPDTNYRLITDEADLKHVIEKLKASGEFSVDLETTSTNPIDAQIVGIAITTAPHEGYYIPILSSLLEMPSLLSQDQVLETLRPVLEDASYQKVGQNIKYDLKVFKRHGADLNGISFDTMLASGLLHPASSSHGLNDLAFTHLNHKMIPIKDLIGTGSKQITMDLVPLPQITEYACEDVDITLQLKNKFESELAAEGLADIFRDIEMPLIPVLADMELAGIKVDGNYLKQLSGAFQERLDQKMDQIYAEAGQEFNINSPKQLGQLLFEELDLPKNLTRRTKTGYSTDIRVLQRLAPHHPLPELILEYRSFSKLKSTYTDALVGLINPDTGRIHTSFHQAGVRTGRLSSSDPNLQNIPVRTAEGREIRRAFVASDDDHALIVADYSQIELRILAHLSGDDRLREAFEQDLDIHAQSAALIFGLPPEEIDDNMRRQAKTMNYGIVYGVGAFRLSNELQIKFDEAQQLINNYFQTYDGVRDYFDRIVAKAQEQEYVTTLLGRRCYVPEIQAADRNTQEFGKRVAINAPMQGTAAELIKLAMLGIHDYLTKNGKRTKLLLQVHDELVFEAPKSEQEEVLAEIKRLMENACQIDVPIKVDIHAGASWLEAK